MNVTRYALTTAGLLAILASAPLGARAQQARASASTPWREDAAARTAAGTSSFTPFLNAYRPVTIDVAAVRQALATAPLEGAAQRGAATVLALPMPDGSTQRFRMVEAPIMEPGLAAQFPTFKTYAGTGIDDPTATLRADLTSLGFHAQVLSWTSGTVYIDPVSHADVDHYVAYYKRDINSRAAAGRVACGFQSGPQTNAVSGAGSAGPVASRVNGSLGTSLRTLRTAVAATGEYTAFHGGTVSAGQAAIVTAINRVTGVYEKEIALRLVLVANNSSLVYTNASTDPYTNNNASTLLTQNQSNTDAVIGTANYDLGHVFSTGGGGLAGLGVVCTSGQKARGETGSGAPTGDAFFIDYVAHEIGHQLGANHTFNGSGGNCSGNRNASTAIEPGSGSTIMAYAGICSADDLQPNSDAYFCYASFEEIRNTLAARSCYTSAATGNTPPSVTVPADKTIPANTPFKLTASGTDAEGDALTYDWEDVDLGASATLLTAQANNDAYPLFRSFNPTTSPTRYFPRLTSLINNTSSTSEKLPTVNRNLRFRCTVRDEHFSSALGRIVGGVNNSTVVTLAVTNTGAAFAVTTPNTAVTWTAGQPATVTWNVASTNTGTINSQIVNIRLSTDGGNTYPITLVNATANDGTETITVPNNVTSTARIMVEAADNYFFDISNANFSIVGGSANSPTITSFSPASGQIGQTVTITGTNFTGATAVRFNGTNAASFTVSSATSITATVAAGSTTGPISVQSANGTGTSSNNFTVLLPPSISSLSPTSGAPGTSVTISGSDFSGATSVAFNGTAATFTVVSSSTITTTVPASATTGSVTVTTPLGTATSSTSFVVVQPPANDLCTAPNLPVLTCGNSLTGTTVNSTSTGDPTGTCTTSIDAASGGVYYRFVGPGGPVTLTTCGLTTNYDSKLFVFTGSCGSLTCVGGNDDVTCGTQSRTSTLTFTSVAGTNYYVLVAGYQGNRGDFILKATCGTDPPTITSFSPTSGAAGTSVTITGTKLNNTQSVLFNGTPAPTFTVSSSTSVSVSVPSGASTGLITLSTTTGTVASATSFTVLNPPVINPQTFSVAENAPSGTVVGTVAATDPDGGSLTYAITAGNGDNAFTMVGSQLRVNNADALNYEAITSFALTIQVTDNGSPASSSSATVTVNVTNVNEAPVVSSQLLPYIEHSAGVVGPVTATDPDGDGLTLSILGGNTGNAFAFSSNQIIVNNAAAVDYESTPSFNLLVQVSDGSLTDTAFVRVELQNLNEVPEIADQSFSLPENSFNGTIAGTLAASDPDAGTTLTYAITNGNHGGAFSLSGNQLQVANAGALDFEANPAFVLTVRVSDGTYADSAEVTVSLTNVVEAPTIAGFTPGSGSVGTSVAITGTNFLGAGAAIVRFNGTVVSSFSISSATSMSVVVPAGATTGPITITNSDGVATSATNFTVGVVSPPTISSFSPTSGVVGTVVTITGTNFTGATAVAFNGAPAASFTVNSATSISATVPADGSTGKISVTAASTAQSVGTFKVVPTISSFSPASGAPGTVVTITGTGLAGVTATRFNGVSASFTVVNGTTITATVPALATTGRLSVVSLGGTATSTGTFTVAPIVTGFIPAQGAPGSIVLVQGLNFSSTTNVAFNGANAVKTYNSTTQITATVPAAATTGPVSVSNATGSTSSSSAYTVVGGAYPTITGFSPTTNVVVGTAVTITGTNFTGATLVRFNNVNATSFTVNSATSITATVPAGALTGKLYVANPSGMGQSAANLTITQPPTISSLSPTSGAVGSVVLIGGANLTGATSVTLNGAAVPYTVNSATQIAATIPAGATTGKFAVTTIAGTGQSTATFTVSAGPAPTITSLSPTSGPRSSTVVVTGTNFTGVTSVKLGTLAASYTVNSPTQITLTVPATATTGRIYVTTSGGGMAQSPTYTVILPPTISSFSPASGAVGSTVTINGTNLTGASSVTFGGVAATSYSVVSSVKITATVPAGAVTGNIAVTTVAGTATRGTFTVTGPRVASSIREIEPVQVGLYPNPAPATDAVWVRITGGTATQRVELLDITGRVVRYVTMPSGLDSALSLRGVTKGFYWVRVAGQSHRLVIE